MDQNTEPAAAPATGSDTLMTDAVNNATTQNQTAAQNQVGQTVAVNPVLLGDAEFLTWVRTPTRTLDEITQAMTARSANLTQFLAATLATQTGAPAPAPTPAAAPAQPAPAPAAAPAGQPAAAPADGRLESLMNAIAAGPSTSTGGVTMTAQQFELLLNTILDRAPRQEPLTQVRRTEPSTARPGPAAVAGTTAFPPLGSAAVAARSPVNTLKLTLPKFDEKGDPEQFWKLFELAMETEGRITPYAALVSTCADYPSAQTFLLNLPNAKTMPLPALKAAFLTRFDNRIQTRKEDARDALLYGKVKLTDKGVNEYAQRFLEKAADAGLRPGQNPPDDFLLIPIFRNGLGSLAERCVVNSDRKPFDTLQSLITFAVGEERSLKARKGPHLNFTTTDSKSRNRRRPSQKRAAEASWVDVAKKQKHHGAHDQQQQGLPRPPPIPRQLGQPLPPLHDPFGLTKIRGPDGRLLSHLEWRAWKADGRCLKCGDKGHIARECPK